MGKIKYQTEEERKEARREAVRRYYQTHKEVKKQYSEAHKEERKGYFRRYKERHTERLKQFNREARKRYTSTKIGRATNLIGSYRQQDKKHNRGECTLTPEWIVENVFSGQHCHYCGESDWRKLGVDRIDNSKPHTPDNVVPCCGECNVKRQKTPYEEFMDKKGRL